MKILIIFSLLFATTLSVYSQRTKAYYIDSNGKETFKSDAIYKRTVTKSNEKLHVEDYYLNDSLAMTGFYQDKSLKTKTDTFKSYYINGKLSHIKIYKNGLKDGESNEYDITGKKISKKNFTVDVPSGEWIWYSKDSGSSQIVVNAGYESVYSIENPPGYQGGVAAYNSHIKSYRYPYQSSSDGYYGQTITTFKISENGELTDIDVILHCTEEMDVFVKKVIQDMPNWIPARKKGNPVSTFYVLPLKFIIDNNEVNISNRTKAKAFYVSGITDYKNNKFENAAFKFKNAILFDNTNAKYYYFYAVCLHQYDPSDKTGEHFKIANMLDDKIVTPEIKEYYNF
jgi:antitoxin component YwqK of YwqJK toxin-antitoxin module